MFKNEKGGALIEAVITLPLLVIMFTLFVVVLDAFHARFVVTDAAREAVRYYAIHGDEDEAETLKKSVMEDGGLSLEALNEDKSGFVEDGDYVTAYVTYDYPVVFTGGTGFVMEEGILDDELSMMERATFKIDYDEE